MTFKTSEVKVVIGEESLEGLYSVLIAQVKYNRLKEVLDLKKALEEHGIKTVSPHLGPWPRDKYIFRNGRYFSAVESGNFGIGGAMIFAKDYMLAPITLPHSVGETTEETRDILCRAYGVSKVYFMPVQERVDHLDLYLLLLADINVLVSDSTYYTEHKLTVDALARAENLQLISVPNATVTIPSDPQSLLVNTYPVNSIDLLDDSGKLLVFTAKPDEESPLVKALANYKVKVIEVPFARQNLSHGSIRCKTNFVSIDYQF